MDPALRIDPARGFLPPADPLNGLPPPFAPWDALGRDLPHLLAAGCLRPVLDGLPPLPVAELDEPSATRAMLLLSCFGHAYVWATWQTAPARALPPALAVPWHQVAERLGRPLVLSYASYVLDNWRRLDPTGPIALGNLALVQPFLGGLDEAWFVLVHVEIESQAGPALAAIGPALEAVVGEDASSLRSHLETVAATMEALGAVLERMPEGCDPSIYYRRVRPYLAGFTQHTVIYRGVAAYGEQPQAFHGATGAQSAVIPSLDALLGIAHADDPLRPYLLAMRRYMPPAHRAFLAAVERGPSVRAFVARTGRRDLITLYNACLDGLARFRSRHLEYAAVYIQRQARAGASATAYGTGGTPFMAYLKKHRDETIAHRLGV